MDFCVGTGPWRRAELFAAGMSPVELRRAVRARELVRLGRGIFLGGADPRAADRCTRHALLVRGVLGRLGGDVVVSHQSAAVLYGLDPWAYPLTRVHVTRPRRTGGRRGPDLHLHTAALHPSEIGEVDGVPVTSLARTVSDLIRTAPFEPAVALADAALHSGLAVPDLAESIARANRRPGNTAARRVLSFADGRSESVGESRSRVRIRRAGLPPPVPQRDVHTPSGQWLARVDFWWDGDPPVAAEFDGRVKYGRLLRPGQDPGEVVFEEKLREDAIRREGVRVARWIWRDLADFTATAARLRALLDNTLLDDRARRHPVAGT